METIIFSVSGFLAFWLFVCVCRTVQLTVSNSLVGRIIGRGGTKINNIQVSSEHFCSEDSYIQVGLAVHLNLPASSQALKGVAEGVLA